jgi:hypothetical protein
MGEPKEDLRHTSDRGSRVQFPRSQFGLIWSKLNPCCWTVPWSLAWFLVLQISRSSPFSTIFWSRPNWFSLPKQVPCRFSDNLSLFGLWPSSKGLGTNLKLLTNKIAWIHWFLDLGPSSKVALRLTRTPFGKLANRLTWGSGTRGELGGVGQWMNIKMNMNGWTWGSLTMVNLGKWAMDEPLEVGPTSLSSWYNGWISKVGQWVNNRGEDWSCTKSFKKKCTMDELKEVRQWMNFWY